MKKLLLFTFVVLFCMPQYYFAHSEKDTILTKEDPNYTYILTFKDTFFGREEMYQICYPKQHRNFFYVIFGLLGVTLALGGTVIYLKHSTNKKLKSKNATILHQNKEITDSITYSKRIQDAILPSEQNWNKILKNSFVLYRPKDIVAGDFYWIEETQSHIFLAAADCTGHGVPGAMLSLLFHNALNKVILEKNIFETHQILDATRELIKETFNKNEKDYQDGMDICLVRISKNNPREIQYSGANNSLIIIDESKNIQEIKADKQPIGRFSKEIPFTKNDIILTEKSTLYLFTDGMIDQFGGPNEKKFMKKNLKNIFAEISALPIHQQKVMISDTYCNWRGKLDQVDDVLIIGVEIQ